MTETLLAVLLIPLAGTVAGAAFVFMVGNGPGQRMQRGLLGFASGVMVAASVWSLLIPAMELGPDSWWRVVPTTAGFCCGMGFLLCIDRFTPHLHPGGGGPEGPESKLSRTAMLSLAVTIHNLPEGMAVGVVTAGMLQGSADIAPMAAIAMAVGIAIQNVPEGAIVSMPLRTAGNSRRRSFLIGCLSGMVEPVGALTVIVLASAITPALPFLLAFAAGSMMYVVVEELIPEASQGEHSNLGTVGFGTGFVLMMVLDVVLG